MFSGGLLPAAALRELNQFVAAPSDVTDPGAGEPTDTTDPDGYTLGWDHGYDAAIGPFWFNLGNAPGYQSWTGWFPCSNLAVSIGTNQAPTDSTGSSTSGIEALHEMAVDAVLHSPDFSTAVAAHPAPYLRTCPRDRAVSAVSDPPAPAPPRTPTRSRHDLTARRGRRTPGARR